MVPVQAASADTAPAPAPAGFSVVAPTSGTAHYAPPGGSESACLAPIIAKVQDTYAAHEAANPDGKTLKDVLVDVLTHPPTICAQGMTVGTGPAPTPPTSNAVVAHGLPPTQYPMYPTWTCDGFGYYNCYVAPGLANWSETFYPRFACNGVWAFGGDQYPGTSLAVRSASVPGWSVTQSPGPYWVWHQAGYGFGIDHLLARAPFQVTIGVWWFSYTWNGWLWENMYYNCGAQAGLVGSFG